MYLQNQNCCFTPIDYQIQSIYNGQFREGVNYWLHLLIYNDQVLLPEHPLINLCVLLNYLMSVMVM